MTWMDYKDPRPPTDVIATEVISRAFAPMLIASNVSDISAPSNLESIDPAADPISWPHYKNRFVQTVCVKVDGRKAAHFPPFTAAGHPSETHRLRAR